MDGWKSYCTSPRCTPIVVGFPAHFYVFRLLKYGRHGVSLAVNLLRRFRGWRQVPLQRFMEVIHRRRSVIILRYAGDVAMLKRAESKRRGSRVWEGASPARKFLKIFISATPHAEVIFHSLFSLLPLISQLPEGFAVRRVRSFKTNNALCHV